MLSIELNVKPSKTEITSKKYKKGRLFENGFALNKIGSEIWKMCDGENSVKKMIDKITQKYDEDRDAIEEDIISLLNNMKEKELISW